jgi:ATP-dependent RNA helicase DHX36
MVKTVEDGSVMIHPKSVNAKEVEHESPFLVYHQKQKLSKVMLFDTTMVSPFALIFFGGKLDFFVRSNIPLIEVDTNIRFKITKDTFDTIQVNLNHIRNFFSYALHKNVRAFAVKNTAIY